ncbi:MAG: formate dehydrogenase subunit delta [Deltaproteobacteria bacterium]
MQSSDKLVMMANQIARNLMVHGDDEAASLTADHMRKFWEPRMRVQILERLEAGGAGLSPVARRAVEQIAPATLAR